MKTAVEYLLEYCERENWSIPFDVEHTAKAMEKEMMCEFADEFSRECIDFHHAQTMSPDRFFELTFNTKEK